MMTDDYNDPTEQYKSQWHEAMAMEHCESCGHKFEKGEEAMGKLHSLGRIEKVCMGCRGEPNV